MSAWRVGFWNGRGGHRQIFKYTDEHKNRMGSGDWLPTDGDLCLRLEDAGDCFHTYIALRRREDGKYERAGKFGAYIFGEAICMLDERTFYLACAGEPIDVLNHTVERTTHTEESTNAK